MRVLVIEPLGVGQADLAEHLHCYLSSFGFFLILMEDYRFYELRAYGKDRV